MLASVAHAKSANAPARDRAQGTDLPPGVELVERVEADPSKVTIPFQKYRLPNGLTVILTEDHSDPLAYVSVTYHVGSARETPGRSGFAHFFEHMMFQGSAHVGDNQHFKMIAAAGGSVNGSTNTDQTNYYEIIPANYLEQALWLEADRMGFLLPAITETAFENQRATVKNERGQKIDNAPYGLMGERMAEALYPKGHPYSWPTIGYIRDLDRADLRDLKNFFLNWYGPNNATLAIGGDFDPARTLRWVARYFGPIPSGPRIAPLPKTLVTLDAGRYITLEDDVPQSRLQIEYPTVHVFHPDEAALDLLQTAIASGNSSLLYRNLIDSGLAVTANASHGCKELACTFSISVAPSRGVTLAQLKAGIDKTFREFEEQGITKQRIRASAETMRAARILTLQSVASRVGTLTSYEIMTGDPNYIHTDLGRYGEVTPQQVRGVYDRYIKDKPAVYLSVVQEGHPDQALAPQNWSPPPAADAPAGTPAQDDADVACRVAMRTPHDDFDRSVPPRPGPPVVPTMPELWHATLPNGVRVMGAVNSEAPVTNLWIRFDAGQVDQPIDELGVTALTNAMVDESTTLSSAESLGDRLRDMGSAVSFHVSERNSAMSVLSLSDNFPQTLAIAREKLLHLAFDPSEFAREKAKIREAVRRQNNDPGAMSAVAFELALLGPDNPSSYFPTGIESTFEPLTVDQVRAYYEGTLLPSLSNIVVVSSLSKKEVLAQLVPFGKLPRTPFKRAAPPAFPRIAPHTLYLIDKPGAAQSRVRVGRHAPTYDAFGDYFESNIMNYPLGGGFSSRINLNLREDKGYTYGAGSGFTANDDYGSFSLSTSVRTDATGAALQEIMGELRRYSESGMTQEELDFTRRSLSQIEALAYEGSTQKAGLMMNIFDHGLPEDFRARQRQLLQTVSLDTLNGLAARLIRPGDMFVVVVGDRDEVLPQLDGLGFHVVEVDTFLNPVAAGEEDGSSG